MSKQADHTYPRMAARWLQIFVPPFATCQFIFDADIIGPACKCGKPSIDGFSYCAEHKARCYVAGSAKNQVMLEAERDSSRRGHMLQTGRRW